VVAGERARIARDLNTLVARDVTAMVIQAEVAQRVLTSGALEAIEAAGHQVLSQLRRILGVLRHGDATYQLSPQPGLGQIHTLVQQSRTNGQQVDLRIEGEPGTLLAGVDLVTYRILEEVLGYVGPPSAEPMLIELRFADHGLELDVSADQHRTGSWPSPAIRERVALYDGEVRLAVGAGRTSQLRVRLPRVQGAFA
jgi:glucose-6-phosphate-specific signal transduction histidine kinase